MKGEALSPLLRVRDLSVALPQGADRRFAVEGASFDLAGGEILCVVGESGSGKSVLSSTIMGAAPAGLRVLSGSRSIVKEVLSHPDWNQVFWLAINARQFQRIPAGEPHLPSTAFGAFKIS